VKTRHDGTQWAWTPTAPKPRGALAMSLQVRPFLMFEGKAEEAIKFYLSLFPAAEVVEMVRYGTGEAGAAGTVMKATFTVGGQTIMCTDSAVKHDFTFTPAFSLFVSCDSEDEIRRLSSSLADGGVVLMPLDNYGFSQQFAWINDRFGVSWQINLE
jgi:predicted 3-demethylubiquinone-9 3-methyltransferase (glyoxalase superfamily)